MIFPWLVAATILVVAVTFVVSVVQFVPRRRGGERYRTLWLPWHLMLLAIVGVSALLIALAVAQRWAGMT